MSKVHNTIVFGLVAILGLMMYLIFQLNISVVNTAIAVETLMAPSVTVSTDAPTMNTLVPTFTATLEPAQTEVYSCFVYVNWSNAPAYNVRSENGEIVFRLIGGQVLPAFTNVGIWYQVLVEGHYLWVRSVDVIFDSELCPNMTFDEIEVTPFPTIWPTYNAQN